MNSVADPEAEGTNLVAKMGSVMECGGIEWQGWPLGDFLAAFSKFSLVGELLVVERVEIVKIIDRHKELCGADVPVRDLSPGSMTTYLNSLTNEEGRLPSVFVPSSTKQFLCFNLFFLHSVCVNCCKNHEQNVFRGSEQEALWGRLLVTNAMRPGLFSVQGCNCLHGVKFGLAHVARGFALASSVVMQYYQRLKTPSFID